MALIGIVKLLIQADISDIALQELRQNLLEEDQSGASLRVVSICGMLVHR